MSEWVPVFDLRIYSCIGGVVKGNGGSQDATGPGCKELPKVQGRVLVAYGNFKAL